MAEETAKTEALTVRSAIEMGNRGLALASLDDAWRFAQFVVKSGIVPKDMIGKPEAVLIAIQMGAELGLPPMASLQNIAVINGRPSVWGDCALAIVQAHPQYEWHKEFFEGEGDSLTAVFQIKRKGQEVHETRFSMAEAKQAGLLEKSNTPWQTYPRRMCQWRARSWGIRDKFADALRGMQTAEEVADYPGQTIVAEPQPQLDEAETKLRAQAEELMKARGFNEAQRTAHLAKFQGRMQELVDKYKQDATTTKADANSAVPSGTAEASANSSTPEGQDPVTPSNSQSGCETEPRPSAEQPSGDLFQQAPPQKQASPDSRPSSPHNHATTTPASNKREGWRF